MPTIQDAIFLNLKPDSQKLAAHGFTCANGQWTNTSPLISGFTLTVQLSKATITTTVTDLASGAPYVLHLNPANTGTFVSQVRDAYVTALKGIAATCFVPSMFATGQMQQVIAAIATQFKEQPEYLWKKFSNNAIIRRTDNRKWYALLVKVTPDKVGLTGTDPVDLLVLRADSETITAKIKAGFALPAYHMNKQHWLSYQLDNGMSLDDLMVQVTLSRALAV